MIKYLQKIAKQLREKRKQIAIDKRVRCFAYFLTVDPGENVHLHFFTVSSPNIFCDII